MTTDPDRPEPDPKGLIREAYRMEVGPPECRSIFLDWALSLPAGLTPAQAIPAMLERHGAPDHPMTDTLRAGLDAAPAARRRGGRAARVAD
ncbi:MAG: hypothetical protein ACU0BF_03720 [Paracoccaceae bacterium]